MILHIARVTNDSCAGVNVAVPQHIFAQQENEIVGFLNITNVQIAKIQNQLQYRKKFSLKELVEPFNEPDIIVFHEVYYLEYLKIYRALVRKKIPYVIIPHGCLTRHAQKKKYLKKAIANKLLFNKFIYNAAAVQFLSEKEKDNSNWHVKKIIGTNGINVPQNIKACDAMEGVRIVYIGALLLDIKGIDLMLEAIYKKRELFEKNKITVNLYGPDVNNSHKNIEQLIDQLEMTTLVKVCKAVYGEEKKKILQQADIFVQTSRTEGMSMGLLEALSYGKPCLVTEGTNLDMLIEEYDAGWGSATNANAIANAFEQMIFEREKWNDKSRNAKKLVETEFAWEIVSKNAIKKYKELCKN